MNRGFHRAPGGGVSVTLGKPEIELLRNLLDQMLTLYDVRDPRNAGSGEGDLDDLARAAGLSGMGFSATDEPPADPVLARLFPDAYTEDEEAAREFRRYTERDLLEDKRANALTALRTLDRGPGTIHLDEAEAQAWLLALNDVRLALGTRWEIPENHDEVYLRMGPDDPRRPVFSVYGWLSVLQETLVEALW
ncbi:DUF2017 domain-containing protein [Carbonactinospora thermoautotrophica]|uniref:Uncharacterized protein n=1 Tax=Carbonactinospora thermoautotrophica TaxID=1469144 RepID=A0A132MWL0_9ACTN|nr:DUF2017 domain-containing protein [Carbonactinospora thermoautotrophica]KWX02204.1 Uncharacterized protein LI90_3247 [Carbonactinospora thermoautotrophica]MCX9190109.1 DUF2017 domain-containing protein [Carbonactinospora thermoautotrophica]